MLAAKDASKITFPLYASPKVDGIRALIVNGRVMSRTLKPIPNRHVQSLFGDPMYDGLDGELCVGPANAPNAMQATTSGVMAHTGEPDVTFWIFDRWDAPGAPYKNRLKLVGKFDGSACGRVKLLEQKILLSQADLDAYEADCLEQGYEGVMVRNPYTGYKFGRATAKGGELTKIKRFEDAEAVVVGFEERMHNDNEATKDAFGRTKRSSHQENKRAAGDLGALVCHLLHPDGGRAKQNVSGEELNVSFNIGTGFTAAQRQAFWADRFKLIGRIAKFKYFAATGVLEAPRFPVFIGFRSTLDVGEAA